jgi:hypothetical protein
MQDNQATSTVQLGATIGHPSISLRMAKHTKHATTVELPKEIAVLLDVQQMLQLKFYNNLNNRKAHYKT